ncbi:hypothetical protein EHS13_26750 [Paenibacillus psychroresistens]|uniref:Uncharacterized protein n=1 Tax=Paenibacillus psychroresistens TaxID=1778678 RepID=A0A6B8RQV6_9BACL|nr:hypothetical protein [Paenibacillus psychroresistens]QGQ98227.1 hypothetical protein EHS13_26750 [Paenibacillus psychroresistens]
MKKPFAKQIILGTMALTLVAGGGYILKGQDAFAATTATTTDNAKASDKPLINNSFGIVKRVNDELIAFLKLEKSSYQEKIASGKTLAEIATEQGISRDALKAELTKEVTASLDKEKADFVLNLDKTVDAVQPAGRGGEGFGPDGRHGGGFGGPGDRGGDKHGGAKIDLTTIATALGYATEDELRVALETGKSIAELATEKKVTLQTLIDLEVVQIVKNLDQQLADGKITQTEYDKLKADSTNIATNQLNDKHNGRGEFGGQGGPGGGPVKTDLTSVATALGYATTAELKTALTSGKSIADLASAKNVTVQSLIDLQVKEITKSLDADLASSKLTQAEYDKKKAGAVTEATNIINDKHDGQGGPGERGGRGGKGGPGGKNRQAPSGQAPADSSTSSTTAPTATSAT